MILLFIAGVLVMFVAYYLMSGACKPAFIGGKGALRNIVKIVSSNIGVYRPTPWLFGGHLQTIFAAIHILKSQPSVEYFSEIIRTSDGGIIQLDWSLGDKEGIKGGARDIILILPGLTGTSQENYVLRFVKIAKNLGYGAVVMNHRGSGTPLVTYRACCAANTDDLALVLRHLHESRPTSRVCAVGVSLGGIILTNYLAEMGSTNQNPPSSLLAAFVVSIPWDLIVSTRSFERPLTWLLFNRYLTRKLQRTFKDNVRALKARGIAVAENIVEATRKANTIREFDEAVVAPMFGYRDVFHYYTAASVSKKTFEAIKTPLLCLNAADDPFSPDEQIPVVRIKSCDNVAMVLTRTGGHVGFLEGFLPTGENYMDRVYKEYIQAVFKTL